jgi:putative membrane protein
MRTLPTALILALAAAAPLHASGQAAASSSAGTGAVHQTTGADAVFVRKASAAGLAEVALGQLGASQGQAADVKQFGQQMVTDHTAANDELSSIASGKGLAVSKAPMPADQAFVQKLKGDQGASFDSAFSRKMLVDHRKAVALFKQEAAGGKDPELKAFAQKTLPTLEHHLQMARALGPNASAGKATEAGR